MIVTRLIGGLGNQMFQYAVGRALAARRGVPVAIDRRGFAEYKVHAYGLDNFALAAQDAPDWALPRSAGGGRVQRLLRRLRGTGPLKLVVESGMAFDPTIVTLPDNVYLDGYWQSERYFADMADTIRADFQVRHAPSAANAEWLQRIGDSLSVSIHVRRGDYVSNPAANKFHGTCGLDYYERAIADIRARVDGEPVFFVFSDDPDWTRDNLNFAGCVQHFIRDNDAATNYEDLRLMAACRHHIIANSTFSWWGAWLNPRADKTVIAPARWFAETRDTSDLLPQEWVRL